MKGLHRRYGSVEDLGVNLEAAGIILDLLEERRELEFRLRQLEQLLG